jgi:hypothetical protein
MNYSTQSYISIGETAQILGVDVVTIRRCVFVIKLDYN